MYRIGNWDRHQCPVYGYVFRCVPINGESTKAQSCYIHIARSEPCRPDAYVLCTEPYLALSGRWGGKAVKAEGLKARDSVHYLECEIIDRECARHTYVHIAIQLSLSSSDYIS